MEKRLFLTGSMSTEKSALLRELLGDRLMYAGGYLTDAATDDKGGFIGMQLRPAAAGAGVSGFEAELFIDCRSFPPKHDNEVFRVTGVRLLEQAQFYPFAVIDEFGGYETVIPQFRAALYELLNSGLPCIGTIKKPDEADMMRRALGLGERVNEHIAALWDKLENDGDTRILDLDSCTKEEAEQETGLWLSENGG